MRTSNLQKSLIWAGIFSLGVPILLHGYLIVMPATPRMQSSSNRAPQRINYKMLAAMNYNVNLETSGSAMWYEGMEKQVQQQVQTERLQALNYSKQALENLLNQQAADSTGDGPDKVYYAGNKVADSITPVIAAVDTGLKFKDTLSKKNIAANSIVSAQLKTGTFRKRN